MSERGDTVRCELCVGGVDPEAVSAALGVRPDLAVRSGEAHPRTGRAQKIHLWRIETPREENGEPEAHIRELFRRCPADRLASLDTAAAVWVRCVVYAGAGTYPCVIAPDVLALLVEVRASLHWDMYFVGSE